MLKNLSDNLNMLMAKARLNSSELARLTGLPATTIKRIRNNEQSNPTVSTLFPIVKYFSTTISELLGSELHSAESMTVAVRGELSAIPLLSWHDCVNYEWVTAEQTRKKIQTERQLTEKAYALVVEDKGLDFFPKNSMLIIEPRAKPESGDYVVVAKSQPGKAAIKKYIIETDQVYLKSLVEGVGIVSLTAEYKLLGVIVQYRLELK